MIRQVRQVLQVLREFRIAIFAIVLCHFGIVPWTIEGWSTEPRIIQSRDSNLNDIPTDLTIPKAESGAPTAGRRVRATAEPWKGTEVYHTLYLPTDWQTSASYPILVEYPGNGGYKNLLGDASDGSVDGCKLGYGLSEGKGFLWLVLPYVNSDDGVLRNADVWWGDVEETKRYCLSALSHVISTFGGDENRVVLCGFSRGAIGCNFIGLHDDEISKVWRGFFCHSHYDGVREKQWYPGGDRASALERLARLRGRPQWISHEKSIDTTRDYLTDQHANGKFTFETLPYPNHSADWVLRDLPLRTKAREWLHEVTK